jgi:hypothetical protein
VYLNKPSQIKRLSKRLKINLEEIPDFSFSKTREYTTSNGEIVPVYQKKLTSPCLGLFNTVECHGKGEVRVLYFGCKEVNKINFRKFVDIVNGFWLYNKKDCEQRGRVSKIEEDFDRVGASITRDWIDSRYPIVLEFNNKTVEFIMEITIEYNSYLSDEELETLDD